MFEATLNLGNDLDLKKVFELEDRVFKNNRASYDVYVENNLVFVKVLASDSVALRSVLNTITKILTVYEKAFEVVKSEKRN
ncbi:MAG: hypothetical protein ACMXX6_01335 [Candidatus Woesearchaeota archaeon]